MFYSLRQIAPESKFSHLLYLDVFEQIIPLALICEVLSQTQRWEKRERALNMVTVIVLIIAMGLLPYLSIAHVLQKIASGLRYVWPDPCMKLPGASALSQRRQQLGVLPLRRLFERICRKNGIKQLLTRNANETDPIAAQGRELALLAQAYATPEHKEAVAAFLEGVMGWTAIADTIREVLEDHDGTTPKSVDVVIDADRRTV